MQFLLEEKESGYARPDFVQNPGLKIETLIEDIVGHYKQLNDLNEEIEQKKEAQSKIIKMLGMNLPEVRKDLFQTDFDV